MSRAATAIARRQRRLGLSFAAGLLVALVALPAAAQLSTEFDAISAAAEEPDAIASMVFGERSLDAIVALGAKVRSGSEPPWTLFRRAQQAERRGDVEGAANALGAVLALPDTGSGVALWTWSNLRRLGFEPVAGLADQVQGVVYENPSATGVEYLAAYADGRWRIINGSGNGIFWEETGDSRSNAIIDEMLAIAQRLSYWAPNTPERDPGVPSAPRITLLTWAGMRQIALSGPLNAEGMPSREVLTELTGHIRRLQDFAAEAAGATEQP